MSGKCTSDQVRLFVICLLALSVTHVPYFPNWVFSNIQAISIATNNTRQLTAGVPFVLTTLLSQMTQRHLSCAPPVQRSIRSIHYVPKTGAHVAKYTQIWIKILVFGINNRVCSIRISSTRLPTRTCSPRPASNPATKSTTKVRIRSKLGARTTEASLIPPAWSSLVFNQTRFNMDFPIWSRMKFEVANSTVSPHNYRIPSWDPKNHIQHGMGGIV